MSLRTKIIFLFVLLAIVPMLALAGFSYGYARSLVREAIQEQLQQTAMVVGQELERTRAEIDERMEALVVALSREADLAATEVGDPWTPGDFGGLGSAGLADSLLSDLLMPRATFVGIGAGSGPIQVLAGEIPADRTWRSSGESSKLLEFSKRIPRVGNSAILTAGFWAADLVTREGWSLAHSVVVLDPADGTVLYADRWEGVEAGARLDPGTGIGNLLGMPGSSEGFRFRAEGKSSLGAFTHLPAPGWTVVATGSMAGALEPLSRLAAAYWMFVLALGFFTAMAFSILIGHFTRSLSELARAAEEIGLGELDPWLPLHTSGELGQLSNAFSGMLARIRQMMAQVDQSGRLAVVGQLSAYLAHEIRNPLSSIKLNLQRLRRWTRSGDLPEYCLEPLEISLREVERLSLSVSGVLQLSRAEDSPRKVVSLHQLVEEAADLLASKFRRQGVGLSLDLDAEADRILARVGQVKSAVLNLMVNALEAQPSGGRLEIRTELTRVPELGGAVVALHFNDEGPGVPSEIRDRIFEPFFTTKPGGSGIGLAMASQSVRANGGELHLEPSFMVGKGSDFVAVFPLAALEATTGVSRSAAVAGRSGSIPSSARSVAGGRSPSASSAAGLGGAEEDSPEEAAVPTHLMTPEGLRAVLALSRPDPEEVH